MSKTTLKVITYTDNGKPAMPKIKRAEVDAFYQKYSDRNIEVKFSVLPKRSVQENRYYFGVVLPMMVEAANSYGNDFDVDSMHEWCKKEFNGQDVINAEGVIIGRKGLTTTDLNNEEFFDGYLEQIRKYAAENFYITIPDPGQQTNIMFADFDKDLNTVIVTNV